MLLGWRYGLLGLGIAREVVLIQHFAPSQAIVPRSYAKSPREPLDGFDDPWDDGPYFRPRSLKRRLIRILRKASMVAIQHRTRM